MIKENITLKEPTEGLVREYMAKFENSSEEQFRHYSSQEEAVMKVREKFSKNDNLIEILLKVGVLNSFYSTNIFKPFAVAERILALNIDEKLAKGDPSLVQEISKNKISGKNKNFYSFATKYCSMHNPDAYPIYDSYIGWILKKYKKQYHFCDFREKDLREYTMFIWVLKSFQNYFNLMQFSFKEIDKFLWRYAKEIKPNIYLKKKVLFDKTKIESN